MGWIKDLLVEVPLSAVLQERIKLGEEKYEKAIEEAQEFRQKVTELEKEVEELRAKIPVDKPEGLKEETIQVMVYLFKSGEDHRAIKILAQNLQMELGVAKYHLELLGKLQMARMTHSNYLSGHIYWDLTPKGRSYVVENGLVK